MQYGNNNRNDAEFSVNHIRRHMLLVSLIPGSENFDHLVKVAFIRQLHFKVSPFVTNKCNKW